MQTAILQLLALTVYGNSYLSGNSLSEFYPKNSLFRFPNSVKFVDLEKQGSNWVSIPHSNNPLEWFEKIKREGVIQIRAHYYVRNYEEGIPDRQSVAFIGGGGRWLMECVKSTGSDFWERWWGKIGDYYGRSAKNSKHEKQNLLSVSNLIDELKLTLKEIKTFSIKNNCDPYFTKCFSDALHELSTNTKEKGIYEIYPPNFLSQESEQLINACHIAYVFGGMGSWNDLGFNDDLINQEYEDLSDRLFNLINLSLIAAVNSKNFENFSRDF